MKQARHPNKHPWIGVLAAFTEQREREIAEVQEEIALIQDDIVAARTYGEKYQVIRRRVLAVEQARLAELRRGMKEGSE